jgi:hypothetical protein
MEVSEGEYEILKTIACPSLPYNTPGTTYVLVKIPDDQTEGIIILQNEPWTMLTISLDYFLNNIALCQK